MVPTLVARLLKEKTPFLWLNERWRPLKDSHLQSRFDLTHVREAEGRFARCGGLLARLFPELASAGGVIESALHPADNLQRAMLGAGYSSGRWLIKGDHALPVAGSIKARGGIYEVLVHAEDLAQRQGLMFPDSDPLVLASEDARSLFARYKIVVGSTGNLGLSIGVMAAALGFRAVVHMSSEAKAWKKMHLRTRSVEVIEHDGDYETAVAAGRSQARGDSAVYFVDDEDSEHLFLGYSVAALRLKEQLIARGVDVDAGHPLFVYLPCGVGGAPGGITFGLRHLFGDHVHCFFAEPSASPCMLIRLAADDDRPISVRDIGLDNCTEADGLAVARASDFVAALMRPLVSGVFTVPDSYLFRDLFLLEQAEGLSIEPSAAAAMRGPIWLTRSASGKQYLAKRGLLPYAESATHVIWTTGGALVPEDEYLRFHARGRDAWLAEKTLTGQVP